MALGLIAFLVGLYALKAAVIFLDKDELIIKSSAF